MTSYRWKPALINEGLRQFVSGIFETIPLSWWKPALINEGLRLDVSKNNLVSLFDKWKPALINEGLRHLNMSFCSVINLFARVETCPD